MIRPGPRSRHAIAIRYMRELTSRMRRRFPASTLVDVGLDSARAPSLGDAGLAAVLAAGLIVAATFSERQRRLFATVLEAARNLPEGRLQEVQSLLDRHGQSLGSVIRNAFSDDPVVRWQCAWMDYAMRQGLDHEVKQDLQRLHLHVDDFLSR